MNEAGNACWHKKLPVVDTGGSPNVFDIVVTSVGIRNRHIGIEIVDLSCKLIWHCPALVRVDGALGSGFFGVDEWLSCYPSALK